ncbi:MAG: CCA tRNA nucleotidyltransferase [Oscillospiraceae bacterium]|nr:CCA tRNA nucleotidyltransferase [Oscillospiraceae bacterium]
MKITIPKFVGECVSLLEAGGHPTYVVGGCLRDSLLGKTPQDWDICTAALPEQMQAALIGIRTVPTGLSHGTLTILGGKMSVEATTFRRDGLYLDHRRPDSVDFSASIEDDLARRDFTVNAMAYNPKEGLIDPFGGQRDLAAGLLRCVGDPLLRFGEDALRVLRLVRFVAQLGFVPHPQTLAGAKERAGLLRAISAERVQAELDKLVMGEHALAALRIAAESGVLAEILPEFTHCIGFDQRSPYHNLTVDEHSFVALVSAPKELEVRLALLFHDIGKPATATIDEAGRGHYKGHAGVGAKIVRKVLKRLRYPTKVAKHIEKLVAFHSKQLPPRPDVIRRFLGEHGEVFTRDLLKVKAADNSAKAPICGDRSQLYKQLSGMIDDLLAAGDCLTLAGLAVNGADLAELAPTGPQTGKVLRELLKLVWRYPEKNTREYLLAQAIRLLEQKKTDKI